MKRKRKRPTPEDWSRWEETQRLLAERVALLEEQIAARRPEPLAPELQRRIALRAQELLDEDPRARAAETQRLLAERIAYNEVVHGRGEPH